MLVTIVLGLLIGTVTFVGSAIAGAKLHGVMKSAPILYPMQKQTNAAMLAAILIMGVFFVLDPSRWYLLIGVIAVSTVLGVTSVIPIGGADMPVVISLMNSYSGLAGAMTGFIISNPVLIIAGTLVGTSGIILTDIMCKAMNRSLGNVLFAGVGADYVPTEEVTEQRTVIRYTADDIAMMLENAQSVIIVPGYGLAVAQAQHVLHEMGRLLIERGATVRYAIHPVAGRMPGHLWCPARMDCPGFQCESRLACETVGMGQPAPTWNCEVGEPEVKSDNPWFARCGDESAWIEACGASGVGCSGRDLR